MAYVGGDGESRAIDLRQVTKVEVRDAETLCFFFTTRLAYRPICDAGSSATTLVGDDAFDGDDEGGVAGDERSSPSGAIGRSAWISVTDLRGIICGLPSKVSK